MQIERSPGGSLFPYYYKDGELFCLHFGSYHSDEEGVIAMMKAEEDFLNAKHRSMGIWIDFIRDQTFGSSHPAAGRDADAYFCLYLETWICRLLLNRSMENQQPDQEIQPAFLTASKIL